MPSNADACRGCRWSGMFGIGTATAALLWRFLFLRMSVSRVWDMMLFVEPDQQAVLEYEKDPVGICPAFIGGGVIISAVDVAWCA